MRSAAGGVARPTSDTSVDRVQSLRKQVSFVGKVTRVFAHSFVIDGFIPSSQDQWTGIWPPELEDEVISFFILVVIFKNSSIKLIIYFPFDVQLIYNF